MMVERCYFLTKEFEGLSRPGLVAPKWQQLLSVRQGWQENITFTEGKNQTLLPSQLSLSWAISAQFHSTSFPNLLRCKLIYSLSVCSAHSLLLLSALWGPTCGLIPRREALLEWNVAGITETSSFPGEKSLLLVCMCSTFWENSNTAFMRSSDLNQGQAVNLDG